jgi:hypothetical protein
MRARGRHLGAAAVAGAAVLLAAGIAYATIPDSNGVVHACVKGNGDVSVIDPSAGQTCGKDAPLDWNEPGASGADGQPGPPGLPGAPGAAGSSGYERVVEQFSTDTNGNGQGEADCPTGKRVLSGGYELTSTMRPSRSAPTSDGGGWVANVEGTPGAAFVVFAICVDATTGGGS